MLTKAIWALLAGAVALALPTALWAADHTDSPSAIGEPAGDITDLYAWMTPEADKLNLAVGVMSGATAASTWSDAVVYAFHVNSSTGYGEAQTETTIRCKFYSETEIECWGGGAYVEGDPSSEAGIISGDGRLRVFAGLRNDPFFFELAGFSGAVGAVIAAAPSLTFDAAGCPAVDAATSEVLVGALQGGDAGPSDTLAGSNVMALVIQVDKALVTGGGPVLGVWTSTHAAN